MEENKNQLNLELQDIINRVKAFNLTNPEAIFCFAFMGYKESEEICEDCGEKCMCEPDENKFIIGGHGDIHSLRNLINDLRDNVEDNCDRRGFVSF